MVHCRLACLLGVLLSGICPGRCAWIEDNCQGCMTVELERHQCMGGAAGLPAAVAAAASAPALVSLLAIPGVNVALIAATASIAYSLSSVSGQCG